jgi:hypothetical protein
MGRAATLPNSTPFANADLSRDMSGERVKVGQGFQPPFLKEAFLQNNNYSSVQLQALSRK